MVKMGMLLGCEKESWARGSQAFFIASEAGRGVYIF
jgi:hypothetical protein